MSVRRTASSNADIQVHCGADGCSTLVSSIEIIREFQKAYGYNEARPPAHATGRP